MKTIQLLRAYEGVKNHKGYKILVDRLWPRGIKKEDLPYEWWIKELAPTDALRKSFNHEDDKYEAFYKDYVKELANNPLSAGFIAYLKEILKEEPVIFIFGAKNEKHNQAVVLKEWVESQL